MSKFNFGEATVIQQRKRAATFNNGAKRKATQLSGDDIPLIAKLFYVDMAGVEVILAHLRDMGKGDVKPEEIDKIINGYNFNREWSMAVTDLMADGHEVARRTKNFLGDKPKRVIAQRQSLEAVLRIRQMHLDGCNLSHISNMTECRESTVRAIVRNETYDWPEYRPKGWEE
jgi:hypothetical protein